MKFSESIEGMRSENLILKWMTFSLVIATSMMTGLFFFKGDKPPLILERGCFTEVAQTTDEKITNQEIISFLKKAIASRFSTDVQSANLLSVTQLALREKEQDELKRRGIKQKVIVDEVKFDKDKILVQSDRMIAVGEIRGAFAFPLNVKVEKVSRSLDNPYGLVLTDIDPIKKEGEK